MIVVLIIYLVLALIFAYAGYSRDGGGFLRCLLISLIWPLSFVFFLICAIIGIITDKRSK